MAAKRRKNSQKQCLIFGSFLNLFAAIDSDQTGVFEGGELAAPVANDDGIELGADDAFLLGSIGDDDTMRIDDEAAAGVGELGVGTATVDADDIGEVFDGAGLQQRDPVLDAFHRPGGDVDEHFGSGADGAAGEFGETEIVADERGNAQPLPFEDADTGACNVGFAFATHAEGMIFGVAGKQGAVGSDGEGLVHTKTIGCLSYDAADHTALVFGGDFTQKLLSRAALGLGGDGEVHAEAGGEGFRQDDE